MKQVRAYLNEDQRREMQARIQAARERQGQNPPAPQFTPPVGPLYSWNEDALQAATRHCPSCKGLGYLAAPDVMPGHPDFGKLKPCAQCAPYRTETRNRDLRRQLADTIARYDLRAGLEGCTFDNYQKQPGTEAAAAAARSWALAVIGKAQATPWLYLYGLPGNGKTHLSAAAANGLTRMGVGVIFTRTPELIAMIRAASLDDREPVIRLLQTVPVLIADDFGTEAMTDWASEMMFRVVDWRYVNRYPLLITSQVPAEHIGEMRIRSRIGDAALCSIVHNRGADYRPQRLPLLQQAGIS